MTVNEPQKTFSIIRKNKNNESRCGGIIFDQSLKNVIIVLNNKSKNTGENKWGFPKGKIEKNEKLHECAKREIEEETGLSLDVCNKNNFIKIQRTFYFIFVITKDCKLNPKDKLEIADVKWEKISNISKLNKNNSLRDFLKENFLSKSLKLAKDSYNLLETVITTKLNILLNN